MAACITCHYLIRVKIRFNAYLLLKHKILLHNPITVYHRQLEVSHIESFDMVIKFNDRGWWFDFIKFNYFFFSGAPQKNNWINPRIGDHEIMPTHLKLSITVRKATTVDDIHIKIQFFLAGLWFFSLYYFEALILVNDFSLDYVATSCTDEEDMLIAGLILVLRVATIQV